jgi:hypothetical protein
MQLQPVHSVWSCCTFLSSWQFLHQVLQSFLS